jgi:hypothetical protein
MLRFLKNAKIGTRITLAIAVPVVAMLAFSIVSVVERSQTAASMGKLQELADLAPVVSALVHEMQKERGMSAGFISSRGAKFASELPEQRKLSDGHRQALEKALAVFPVAGFGSAFGDDVSAASASVAQLDQQRSKVTNLAMTVPEMAGYYTTTIARLLRVVEDMAFSATTPG